MTYDNNDGPIYSVLNGKPGTSCLLCEKEGTTTYTSIVAVDGQWMEVGGAGRDLAAIYMACFNIDGIFSFQPSPCP